VLRGIFLCTPAEIDWFMHGIRWFFPEAHADFIAPIPSEERGNLLQAYARRLFCDDPQVFLPAARCWSRYEGRCLFLEPDPEAMDDFSTDAVSLGIGRLEAHYFLHEGFLPDDRLMRNIDRIRPLPAVIVQGRYDVVCPPWSAFRLHAAWPEARLHVISDAGHSAYEPGIAAALVAATERFKLQRNFD
jgi:proline iminopeptidase